MRISDWSSDVCSSDLGIGDTPDELRYQVRRQRKYGAEVIKVCATGGVFSRNTEPGQLQVSEKELAAIAAEAHQRGLSVAAHAPGAEDIRAAPPEIGRA